MRRVLAILAAGSASRAGVDKVAADLGGQPVLAWSLAAGLAAGCFEDIVVIAPAEKVGAVASLARARARAASADKSFSDDAAALVAAGLRPKMVLGERRNLKITTLEDLAYARELVAKGLVGFPVLAAR